MPKRKAEGLEGHHRPDLEGPRRGRRSVRRRRRLPALVHLDQRIRPRLPQEDRRTQSARDRGGRSGRCRVGSGRYFVIFNASETGLLPLLAKGAPIRWSLPEPGIGPMTGQAIPARRRIRMPRSFIRNMPSPSTATRTGRSWRRASAHRLQGSARGCGTALVQGAGQILSYDTKDASDQLKPIIAEFRKNIGVAR